MGLNVNDGMQSSLHGAPVTQKGCVPPISRGAGTEFKVTRETLLASSFAGLPVSTMGGGQRLLCPATRSPFATL